MDEVFADIKGRVSLREIMEADGAVFRRSGGALATCCTLHDERSPSMVLHESAGGDWYRCFGCGGGGDVFSYMQQKHGKTMGEAVEILRAKAGIRHGEDWKPVKREVVEPAEDDVAEVGPLNVEELARWRLACASLLSCEAEICRIAEWRGIGKATIRWAAEREVMGRVMEVGVWREAFAIDRPSEDGTEMDRIGWHVRLSPGTAGNKHGRAVWWYRPRKGLGSWPFALWPDGGVGSVRFLFIVEGQWDALALVDLFDWHQKWPDGVGVLGVRGATTWRRVFGYGVPEDATVFLFGDGDEAGAQWFLPPRANELSFSENLEKRFRKVWAWRPNPRAGKDFNDLIKGATTQGARDLICHEIRKLCEKRPGVKAKKITYYSWLRRKEQKERFALICLFAKVEASRRPRNSRRAAWVRFVKIAKVEVREQWKVSYAEWRDL